MDTVTYANLIWDIFNPHILALNGDFHGQSLEEWIELYRHDYDWIDRMYIHFETNGV